MSEVESFKGKQVKAVHQDRTEGYTDPKSFNFGLQKSADVVIVGECIKEDANGLSIFTPEGIRDIARADWTVSAVSPIESKAKNSSTSNKK